MSILFLFFTHFMLNFLPDFADFHGFLLHDMDEAVVKCFRYLLLYSHMSTDLSIVAFIEHDFDLDDVNYTNCLCF